MRTIQLAWFWPPDSVMAMQQTVVLTLQKANHCPRVRDTQWAD
jgi:hypothetical protein